jgi:hypothetical protein
MKKVGSSLFIKEDIKTNRQVDKQTKSLHKRRHTDEQTSRHTDKVYS